MSNTRKLAGYRRWNEPTLPCCADRSRNGVWHGDREEVRIDVCAPCAESMHATGRFRSLKPSSNPGEFSTWLWADQLVSGQPVDGLASDHDFDSAGPGCPRGRACCHIAHPELAAHN
jgi:hypothetical protein